MGPTRRSRCPFCDSEEVSVVMEEQLHYVACSGCRATGPHCITASLAARLWDTGQKRCLELPISALDPSARVENGLVANRVFTLGDLIRLSENDLLRIHNFGRTSLTEVKRKLQEFGLALKYDNQRRV